MAPRVKVTKPKGRLPFMAPCSCLPDAMTYSIRNGDVEALDHYLKGFVLEHQPLPSTNMLVLEALPWGGTEIVEYLLRRDPSYRPSSIVVEKVVRYQNLGLFSTFRNALWNAPDTCLGDLCEQGDILSWAIRVGDVNLLAEVVGAGAKPYHNYLGRYSHLQLCFVEHHIAYGLATELAKVLIHADLASASEPGILHMVATVSPDTAVNMRPRQIEAIDFLIAYGADADGLSPTFYETDIQQTGKDREEVTVLAAAASMSNFSLVKHLLDRCADPNKADLYGKNTWEVAREVEWERGLELLQDWSNGWRGSELGTNTFRPYRNIAEVPPTRHGQE